MIGPWLLAAMWIAYMAEQGIAARRAAPTLRRVKDSLYPAYLVTTVAGLVLMLTPAGDVDVLGLRIVPRTPVWFWGGFAVTVVGLAFAYWSRRRLGRFWGSAIEVKAGHKLVQDGPYRWVRHPIYSGIILAGLGSGIAAGDLGGALGFAILAAGFVVKMRREEKFIAAYFGAEWRAWHERTWALLPYVY